MDDRDTLGALISAPLIPLRPEQRSERYAAEIAEARARHDRDPDLCCALRKVKPLEQALAGYDAWATGLRRDETHNRVIAPVIGWDESMTELL